MQCQGLGMCLNIAEHALHLLSHFSGHLSYWSLYWWYRGRTPLWCSCQKSRAEREVFLVQEVTLYDGPAMPRSAPWWNGRQWWWVLTTSTTCHVWTEVHAPWYFWCPYIIRRNSSHPHWYLELDKVTFTLSSHNAAKELTVLFFSHLFHCFCFGSTRDRTHDFTYARHVLYHHTPQSWYVVIFYISKRKQGGRETSKFWILINIYFSTLITV